MSTGAVELRERIKRARTHFDELVSEFSGKGQPVNYDTVIVTHRPERESHQITIGTVTEPPLQWRTITGEIIHQLRSTLDNAVCHMALKAGHPQSCCEKTEFPIFAEDSNDTKRAFQKKVEQFVRPEALTAIKDLQPYKETEPRRASLWTIHRLDIIDKHRMLVIVGKRVRVPNVVITDGTREERVPIENATWKVVEPGAKLLEMTIPRAHAKCWTSGSTWFMASCPTLNPKNSSDARLR